MDKAEYVFMKLAEGGNEENKNNKAGTSFDSKTYNNVSTKYNFFKKNLDSLNYKKDAILEGDYSGNRKLNNPDVRKVIVNKLDNEIKNTSDSVDVYTKLKKDEDRKYTEWRKVNPY